VYVYMGLLFFGNPWWIRWATACLSFVCVGPDAMVISSTYFVIFNSWRQNHKELWMSVFHMGVLISSQAILFGIDGHNEICSCI
jgi:hypothetical protein